MNCDEARHWSGALLDGQLDAKNAADIQAHFADCPACKHQYEVQVALSAHLRRLDLSYSAPDSLRRHIAETLDMEPASARSTATKTGTLPPPTRQLTRWLLWAGWPAAFAASAMLVSVLLQRHAVQADEVIAAHVRSLLASHLNDVVSTDHHTVKPWFAGKIDFSPPVPNLAAQGFELVGGRLDYLQQQPVAAVIYRKHGHIINVLAARPGGDLSALRHTDRIKGYSLRSWHQAGLDLVAVSDIDPLELAHLQQGYEATAEAPEPSP